MASSQQPSRPAAHLTKVRRSILILPLAFGVLLLDAAPPKPLENRQWVLLQLDGEPVDTTIRSSIQFSPDDRASGATGCNRWFGSAIFDGASLRFSNVAATRMACPKPAMDRESAFTRMLGLVRSWKMSGGDLRLAAEDGTALAVFRSESAPPGRK
jgi:heat shock protein HslJ